MLRLLRLISWPQLRQSWGRTALVVGGISTGVALIVAIQIMNAGVLRQVRETVAAVAGSAALEVVLGVGEVGFPEDVRAHVAADPDVVAAVPLVRGTVSLATDPATTLSLFGADLMAEDTLKRYRVRAVTDRRSLVRVLDDPHAVLVTAELAAERGLAVGHPFELATPTGIARLTVRGLLETEGLARALGGQLAVMNLVAAQAVLSKDGRLDQLDLVLREGVPADVVARRLRATLPPELTVARPDQRGAAYERFLFSFQAMLTGLSLLSLVAGIYLIYNTTSTAAAARAVELASLRLLGATTTHVFALLMLEALLLGAVGAAAGLGSGIVLAHLLIDLVTDSVGVIFQLRVVATDLRVGLFGLVSAASIGVGAALFASGFAARRASRLDPLHVLRPHEAALVMRRVPRGLVLGWALVVAIAASSLVLEVATGSIAWGNVGSTLWNASVFVIAIPIVVWTGGMLARVLPRLFRAEGIVAAASLRMSPMRTGVTVAAVALVLTLAVVVASLTRSFHASVGSYYEEGGLLRGDLVVSAVATEGGWLEAPLGPEILSELAAVPAVAEVHPLRLLFGQLYRRERIVLIALDEGFLDPETYGPRWYRAGDATAAAGALRANTAVNIGPALADRFGLGVGDPMTLASPTGPVTVRIAGITRDYIADRGAVTMSRRLFVDRWRDPTVSRVNVTLRPGVTTVEARRQIAAALGSRYRLKILTLPEVIAYHGRAIDRAFAFTDAIQLLIAIVTVAGILDLLLSAIIERRRELALWRVVGADRGALRRSVVIEAVTVGGLGTVLGLAVGYVTAWIWVAVNLRYLLGYHLEFTFAGDAAARSSVLVLVMAVAAGYAAAARATRESVLEGIQRE